MVGICGVFLVLGCVVLAIFSRKYQGDLFWRMGSFIYDSLQKRGIRLQGCGSVKKDLEGLYSVRIGEEQYRSFYVEKLRLMLLVVVIGTGLTLLVWGKHRMEGGELQEIPREEAGGGVKKLQLEVKKGREKTKLFLEVEEQLLEEEEVVIRVEQCMAEVEELLKTPSYAGITNVSELPEALEGYPFEILWRRTGESSITGYFYYGDQMYSRVFVVSPLENYQSTTMEEKIQKAIEQENVDTGKEAILRLPQRLEGEELSWKEVREDNSGLLLLLTLISAAGIYFLKDKDLHEDWQKRKNAMRRSYPMVLNKFVLYLGAGMTVRGSFMKIAQDWQKKGETDGGEIYQEMLYACNELNAGVSESMVYQRFGQRTGLEEYTRLATMLSQNLKKGNATLLLRLREESEKAQKENVHIKKKMGEEAQTKLLVPMIMMMTLVMVLVILPAFSSF